MISASSGNVRVLFQESIFSYSFNCYLDFCFVLEDGVDSNTEALDWFNFNVINTLSMDDVEVLWRRIHYNATSRPKTEYECQIEATYYASHKIHPNFCSPTWDSLLCWPATPFNSSAIQSCFSELNGIPYDVTRKSKN